MQTNRIHGVENKFPVVTYLLYLSTKDKTSNLFIRA